MLERDGHERGLAFAGTADLFKRQILGVLKESAQELRLFVGETPEAVVVLQREPLPSGEEFGCEFVEDLGCGVAGIVVSVEEDVGSKGMTSEMIYGRKRLASPSSPVPRSCVTWLGVPERRTLRRGSSMTMDLVERVPIRRALEKVSCSNACRKRSE